MSVRLEQLPTTVVLRLAWMIRVGTIGTLNSAPIERFASPDSGREADQ